MGAFHFMINSFAYIMKKPYAFGKLLVKPQLRSHNARIETPASMECSQNMFVHRLVRETIEVARMSSLSIQVAVYEFRDP